MLDVRDPETPLSELNVLRLRVAALDELVDTLEQALTYEKAQRLCSETRADFLATELAGAMLLLHNRRRG